MIDGVNTSELGSDSGTFKPHIEYFGAGKTVISKEIPIDFVQRFRELSRDIYPEDAIQRMRTDGYNPIIIGYSHTHPIEEISAIIKRLDDIKQSAGHPLTALQEIDPQQLQWIKEFLETEAKFKTSGTIEYREKLKSSNAEHLSLWYLDHDIDVKSIEHPNVKTWIQENEAKSMYGDEEETFGRSEGDGISSFYTAIRRDAYGSQMIERERPDVISVGAMHALKYDMLLGRNGDRSYYYLNKPLDWETILSHWETAHRLFAERKNVEH